MNTEVRRWMEKDAIGFLKEIGVKNGQMILDFGCGEGHYTIPASKSVGKDGKVYALDKDREALHELERIAKEENIRNIELINAKLRIPLNKDSLDVVLCYDVIHYEDERQRRVIYSEVHRVLKKNGLFSVYPKHHKDDYPLDELADMELDDIIKEIEQSGFSLESKLSKRLLHDTYYNNGCILNFRG
jgi:ubiquinone/menaquinone biosynthesis C-methylase UbiE